MVVPCKYGEVCKPNFGRSTCSAGQRRSRQAMPHKSGCSAPLAARHPKVAIPRYWGQAFRLRARRQRCQLRSSWMPSHVTSHRNALPRIAGDGDASAVPLVTHACSSVGERVNYGVQPTGRSTCALVSACRVRPVSCLVPAPPRTK